MPVAGSDTKGAAVGNGLHARDAGQNDGAPPLEVLLDRVKREPSLAVQAAAPAHATSAIADSPSSSSGNGESGSGGSSIAGDSSSSKIGIRPSVGDAEASGHPSSSSRIKQRQNGAVSNGAAPHSKQSDAGWWRELPYVCVPRNPL